MASAYDDAVEELFKASHGAFVTERKRLAGELKAGGDKAGATKLGKINRPPISAWTVNQLWWHARAAFDKLLETAAELREGNLGANPAHREALAKLRARASEILTEGGHAATESTLRRVMTTLSAIAANGGFDPDPPGALTEDRDPPGFEAAGIPGLAASAAAVAAPKHAPKHADADEQAEDDKASRREAADDKRRREAQEAAERAEAAAERRRAEEAAARKAAERHRHEAALRTANGDVERRAREVDRLRKQLADAEEDLAKSVAIAADLEARLAELD
ncbi:MAG TPA: hypothetical protein VFQ53_15725 [Kofleriaceae bacterium]|nr:hypothetical protein [Kofleriaceae bacterium]